MVTKPLQMNPNGSDSDLENDIHDDDMFIPTTDSYTDSYTDDESVNYDDEDEDESIFERPQPIPRRQQQQQQQQPRQRQPQRQPQQQMNEKEEQENNNRFYVIIIIMGIMFSLIPIWMQSPNGMKLLTEIWTSSPSSSSSSSLSCLPEGQRLFTRHTLARYTDEPQILLAFLGVVYDVTDGPYYRPDGSYHFFAGKDGTRAFLTGEFTVEELRDDITDLDESYYTGIDTWLSLYEGKYRKIGRIIGSYYDRNGCETEKLHLVRKRLNGTKNDVEDERMETERFPPCNSEWNGTEQRGRVWCSNMSGGIHRSWIGRPRLFFTLIGKSWRCACVQDDNMIDDWCDLVQTTSKPKPKSSGVQYSSNEEQQQQTPQCQFKHYDDCDRNAIECFIKD
ncbi:Neuferricin [Blomia tropicalis]|nr:Neuferricin [Blomia tropicalis]